MPFNFRSLLGEHVREFVPCGFQIGSVLEGGPHYVGGFKANRELVSETVVVCSGEKWRIRRHHGNRAKIEISLAVFCFVFQFFDRASRCADGFPAHAVFTGDHDAAANVFRGAAARTLGLTRADHVLVVRPERLRFGEAGLPGVVRERRYTGSSAFFQIEADDGQRFEVLAEPDGAQVGARVYVEATRLIALPDGAPRR